MPVCHDRTDPLHIFNFHSSSIMDIVVVSVKVTAPVGVVLGIGHGLDKLLMKLHILHLAFIQTQHNVGLN